MHNLALLTFWNEFPISSALCYFGLNNHLLIKIYSNLEKKFYTIMPPSHVNQQCFCLYIHSPIIRSIWKWRVSSLCVCVCVRGGGCGILLKPKNQGPNPLKCNSYRIMKQQHALSSPAQSYFIA